MIKTRHIINALPLIADALGRKYGVQVHIGGDSAYTDGKNIHLPALPLDADETALNLARAYLDHEAAHLRATDFDALRKAGLSPVEKYVWNTLEDFMVEQKLSAIYPGCRRNLTWLIKRLFLDENTAGQGQLPQEPALSIFEWLLIKVRSLDVPELANELGSLSSLLDAHFPGLRPDLERLMHAVPQTCTDTESCIAMARSIIGLLKSHVQNQPEPQNADTYQKAAQNHKQADSASNTSSPSPKQQLQAVLQGKAPALPADFGGMLGQALQTLHGQCREQLTVAIPTKTRAHALPTHDIADIRTATTALRIRLQALLQSTVQTRSRIGRTGRIEPKRLARLATADAAIFVRKGSRQGVNTAVHILLDSSSSMSGQRMFLACKACYATASALSNIPGISVAVSGFPGEPHRAAQDQIRSWQTVAPILKHKEKMHQKFHPIGQGSTPMASAIWWAMQQLHNLPEERRIILILSDGDPDSIPETQNAIRAAHEQGHEVYGIGIETTAFSRLLPGNLSRAINNLNDLAPAMFELLQHALIPSRQGETA